MKRFGRIEKSATDAGRALQSLSADEWDSRWTEAKKAEGDDDEK